MSILNNKGNPIVFYNLTNEPNYYEIFPNTYNVRPDKQYIEGMYTPGYKKDWVINQEMQLQFQVVSPVTEPALEIFKLNALTNLWESYFFIQPEDITPVGYLTGDVNKYVWTPDEEGEYYIRFDDVNHQSQVFVVHDDLKWNRRLVRIDYKNSTNDYGMIFIDGVTEVWTGTTYFTGVLRPRGVQNEIDGWMPDRGGFKKTRSTPVESAELILDPVHNSERSLINTIFSCDYVEVNGIQYQNEDSPESEYHLRTDMMKFVVNLVEANTSYFTK